MLKFKEGDLIQLTESVGDFPAGTGGEIVQTVGNGYHTLAMCGLRPVINELYFKGVDNGFIEGVGNAGSGSESATGTSAENGAGDVSGACEACGRPYTAHSVIA